MLLDAIKKYKENDLKKLIFKIEKNVFRSQNRLIYYVHNARHEKERKGEAEKEYEYLRKLLFCIFLFK